MSTSKVVATRSYTDSKVAAIADLSDTTTKVARTIDELSIVLGQYRQAVPISWAEDDEDGDEPKVTIDDLSVTSLIVDGESMAEVIKSVAEKQDKITNGDEVRLDDNGVLILSRGVSTNVEKDSTALVTSGAVAVAISSATGVPVATSIQAGVVKVGSGLSVDADGTLSSSAEANVIEIVKVGGSALSVSDKAVDVPVATSTQAGVVKVGGGLTIGTITGALSVSDDVITQVKVGGSPVASTPRMNEGKFGGAVNIPVATASDAGVITVGDGLAVTGGKAGVSVAKDGGLTVDSSGLRVDTDVVATVEYITRVIGGVADALAEVLGEETT